MKTKTHNIFTTGVLTVSGSLLTIPLYAFMSGGIISFVSGYIIDGYGHERNGYGIPVRTYKTHSPLSALFWGLVPAVILFIAVYYLKSRYPILPAYPYFILIQGLLAGQAHLFLDLPTEGGIFISKNKRFALGHFAYNNPLINFAGVLAGVGLIYLAFTGGAYAKDFYNFSDFILSRI